MFHNIESSPLESIPIHWYNFLSVRKELAFHDRIYLFEAEKNTNKPMKIRHMQSWFKKQFKPFKKF